MATFNFTVKVASGKFTIDSAVAPKLTFRDGDTYVFDQADSSNSGHILQFSATANNSGSSEYTTGVTKTGTPGSAGAKTTIVTSTSTTDTLYYYSSGGGDHGSEFSNSGFNATSEGILKPVLGSASEKWGSMLNHNLDITAPSIAESHILIPSGTTGQRPSSHSAGYLRYNTTLAALEYSTGSAWLKTYLNPSITSVAHNTTDGSYAQVGDTIKIVGTNFGTSNVSVRIGTTACTSVSATDTLITCVVPSVTNNTTYDVEVFVSSGLSVTKLNALTISSSPSWASNVGDTTMEYTQGTTITNGAGTEGTSSYQAELFLATSATTTVTQALSGTPVESGGALHGKIEMVAHSTPANGYYLKTASGQALPAVTANTTYSFNIVATEATEGQTATQAVTLTVLANFFGFGGDN